MYAEQQTGVEISVFTFFAMVHGKYNNTREIFRIIYILLF